MRYIYTVLFYCLLPFLFLRLLWRSRLNPEYRKRWRERLGFFPQELQQSIWVHAVSVGESIAAVPLIKALKAAYPEIPLIVTNMTPTGYARVKAALGDGVLQSYIPYDVPDAVQRFLRRTKPLIAVIMETELWPNLFAACAEREIPILIANARLSEKSMRGYQHITVLTKEMLSKVNHIAAQSEKDAERFVVLGLSKNKVSVTGNIKFDMELPKELALKSEALRLQFGADRFIWIAASTHQGEEEIVLAAHQLIREKIPNALLILVPRHPERFNWVADLIQQKQFSYARRSQVAACDNNTAVYLSDTMGELLLMYSICDVAFVGGSLVSVGGHNMLEPAVLHKPVLTGPQLFNFAEISEMLFAAKGMIKITDAETLAQEVIRFSNDIPFRNLTGENAYSVVEKNRGSLQRQLQWVERLISE